jgi:hypothetical protein
VERLGDEKVINRGIAQRQLLSETFHDLHAGKLPGELVTHALSRLDRNDLGREGQQLPREQSRSRGDIDHSRRRGNAESIDEISDRLDGVAGSG